MDDSSQSQDSLDWGEFLSQQPPNAERIVINATKQGTKGIHLALPDIELHCTDSSCDRKMFFQQANGAAKYVSKIWTHHFLEFRCRNCSRSRKVIALAVKIDSAKTIRAKKLGEIPQFGSPIPSGVIRLIQSDRDLFLKGKRCEDQGLGIAAFSYYRRVIENQWTRLVDEIIKVGKGLNAPKKTIQFLEDCRDQNQFSKAVDDAKGALPEVLLIRGHNPLKLLHTALSDGLHNQSDEACLSKAVSIRVILFELNERLRKAKEGDKELADALNNLLNTAKSN